MAAIDKTYTNKWEEYCEYRDWAMGQKFVCPNGDIIRPIDYLYRWNKEDFDGEKYLPIMDTPYSLDYFLIKHCPVKFVRKRMRQVYDDEYISSIENGTSEYDTFTKAGKYGTRFKVIKQPKVKVNLPYLSCNWFVSAGGRGVHLVYNEDKNRWYWPQELHESGRWISGMAHIKTIKSLKRHMRKWKLPKGTIVTAWSGYDNLIYKFEIY